MDLEDILELVRVAKQRIEDWLGATANSSLSISYKGEDLAFDALDVLTLLEAAVVATTANGQPLIANGRTISPIRGAMKVATDLLELVSGEPVERVEKESDGL